ncbi:tRNA (adenosine(37)-N6)-threonylcarbamoyltransferase complex dimerization subunit type 1 TsaB [Mesorhizobium sp. NBSH29]|uniref:tRNA (adenosine(37)-N6)-threonylcarbamoyltransferase complex dimerization subunit type 1 TsaB n=1 Tax=Mesorhizobium sp. NBSH29 TaxID=2654249 RepID=UPI0018969A6E|nr:tRNA (adenosine(37)-N6)-threonylcarbamoyltransferase complex dimerization subunit type 1 TsaB [Mesorhizobium sp. NBSH29]QPC86508.1 tRNA (adenosine(37)-N6)-threonylcarbamoyltransferase complex dimerization subunit type 1 TsaB [Mesorhizobium sp. NBSH29]
MILLAIDTAANLCSVCLYDTEAEGVQAEIVNDIGTGHAERLVSDIEDLLAQAGLDYAALDRIAVSVGPGSFTGVRVGVATARGLSLALKIPAIGITTIDALATEARQAFPERPVLVAIDARRDELYTAFFAADGTRTSHASVSNLESAGARASQGNPVLTGSGAKPVAQSVGREFDTASHAATAPIAVFARLAAQRPIDGQKPKPAYLRAPDAKAQAGFILPRSGA